MKVIKLLAIAPLAATLLTGQVQAQGNPHLDPLEHYSSMAQIQGNPQIGFKIPVRYVAQYRGNPNEGENNSHFDPWLKEFLCVPSHKTISLRLGRFVGLGLSLQ